MNAFYSVKLNPMEVNLCPFWSKGPAYMFNLGLCI